MAKITRKAIKEGLEQIPVETILLGVGAKPKLTHKQREFARQVALGKPKAKAYRETYNSKGKPKTVGNQAYKMSVRPDINMEIEAYKIALEAEKHRTPAQLKSLLIQQLVKHSLDEDFPPAQRVKCLELMGKLYEVGAFEERKTTTVIHESTKVKERLISQLNTFIGKGMLSDSDDGESLIKELMLAKNADAGPGESGESATPTILPPPETGPSDDRLVTHTIPHTESSLETDMLVTTSSKSPLQDVDLEGEKNVTGQSNSENWEEGADDLGEKEGVGGINFDEVELGVDVEMTPLSKLDTMDEGGV